MRSFLFGLPGVIASFIQGNQDLLPRNPSLASEIQAKIALLSDPDLESKMLNGGFFGETEAISLDARIIPVTVAFPADSMRTGALLDISRIGPSLAALEGFVGVWPFTNVREWYGFKLGHTGGGGRLNMEDRGTYADRGIPHDVIIGHELGHSYIGHESLTQFLEVYVYNLVETGSADFAAWTWKRGSYTPFATSNGGVWALMDIYQLIGPQAMGPGLLHYS